MDSDMKALGAPPLEDKELRAVAFVQQYFPALSHFIASPSILEISMKKLWLGILGLVALSLATPVLAADMAVAPQPYVAPPPIAPRPFYN